MTIFKDIYNSIFGKDLTPVWQQFANENNGTYIAVPDHKVQFTYKNFTILFDAYTDYSTAGSSTYETDYSRGIAEFICPVNFKLLITQQGFIDNISKLIGGQDIRIGDRLFDKKFMIKSNDESKTLLLLANNLITDALKVMETVRLDITDKEGLWNEKPKKGNHMLYFVSDIKVTQIDQLHKLNNLFTEILDTLIRICSIKPV